MGQHFGKMLTEKINEVGITKYRLHKLSGVAESSVIRVANGQKWPTDDIIKRFAAVDLLGVSEKTLLEWRMVDDYPEQSTRAQLSHDFQIDEETPKLQAFKLFFDSLSEKDQIEFIRSKIHLADKVRDMDKEAKNKKD